MVGFRAQLEHLEKDVCEVEVHGGGGVGRRGSRSRSADQAESVTLATSAIDVRPSRTLSRPSSRRRRMPSPPRASRDLVGRRAVEDQRADLALRPSSPRRARCGPCSPCRRSARSPPARRPRVVRRPGSRARRSASAEMIVRCLQCAHSVAREALGDDAVDRRGDQERLDAHLDQAGDRRRRVVGVQRREHEVAGQRGLDAIVRRLARRGSRRP